MLVDLESGEVPEWERPIIEVAREAILCQWAALARSLARWQQEFRVPPVLRIAAQSEFA